MRLAGSDPPAYRMRDDPANRAARDRLIRLRDREARARLAAALALARLDDDEMERLREQHPRVASGRKWYGSFSAWRPA